MHLGRGNLNGKRQIKDDFYFFFSFYSRGPYLFGTLRFEKAGKPLSGDMKGAGAYEVGGQGQSQA